MATNELAKVIQGRSGCGRLRQYLRLQKLANNCARTFSNALSRSNSAHEHRRTPRHSQAPRSRETNGKLLRDELGGYQCCRQKVPRRLMPGYMVADFGPAAETMGAVRLCTQASGKRSEVTPDPNELKF